MREKIEMVDLQPEQKERTLNCMTKLYQSLEFFYQLVNDDKLSEENVRTHMGLYESYFTELSDILGYDSAIAEERRSRYTEIRTLREQLRESLAEQSKTITTDLLIEKLNHLDDLFRVWYSSLGFHYASQEKITQRMFLYTVTQELEKEPSCSCVPKECRKYMDEWGIVPINRREDWDIFEDQFHDELLDTDKNRKNLEKLYKKYLPNGGGSIFTFEIKGDAQKAKDFIDNLELFSLLANVADVKSLVIHPATTTHSQCTEEELLDQGIKPNTIRLSIGTENIDDIIQDLDEAFKAVAE